MASSETELILRALDDLRDDLSVLRRETRDDFACVSHRLDETRTLVARIDERTRDKAHEDDDLPPVSKRERAANIVRKHAPAAGAGAIVVAIVELLPQIVKLFS